MTRRTAAALAGLLGATLVVTAACSGSGDEGSAGGDAVTTTTAAGPPPTPIGSLPPQATSGPNPPPIEQYDLPASIDCTPGQPATVTARYTTKDPMTVTFMVDMTQVEAQPPLSGTWDIPVPCDGASHDVAIFAVGPDTSTNIQTRKVVAGAPG